MGEIWKGVPPALVVERGGLEKGRQGGELAEDIG